MKPWQYRPPLPLVNIEGIGFAEGMQDQLRAEKYDLRLSGCVEEVKGKASVAMTPKATAADKWGPKPKGE